MQDHEGEVTQQEGETANPDIVAMEEWDLDKKRDVSLVDLSPFMPVREIKSGKNYWESSLMKEASEQEDEPWNPEEPWKTMEGRK